MPQKSTGSLELGVDKTQWTKTNNLGDGWMRSPQAQSKSAH